MSGRSDGASHADDAAWLKRLPRTGRITCWVSRFNRASVDLFDIAWTHRTYGSTRILLQEGQALPAVMSDERCAVWWLITRDRDVIPFKTGAEAHAAWRMLV